MAPLSSSPRTLLSVMRSHCSHQQETTQQKELAEEEDISWDVPKIRAVFAANPDVPEQLPTAPRFEPRRFTLGTPNPFAAREIEYCPVTSFDVNFDPQLRVGSDVPWNGLQGLQRNDMHSNVVVPPDSQKALDDTARYRGNLPVQYCSDSTARTHLTSTTKHENSSHGRFPCVSSSTTTKISSSTSELSAKDSFMLRCNKQGIGAVDLRHKLSGKTWMDIKSVDPVLVAKFKEKLEKEKRFDDVVTEKMVPSTILRQWQVPVQDLADELSSLRFHRGLTIEPSDLDKFDVFTGGSLDTEQVVPGAIALAKFDPFPRLAPELRAKIWAVVQAEEHIVESERVPGSRSHFAARISPESRVPPVLFHVNRESRGEMMKIHTLVKFDTATYDGYVKNFDGFIYWHKNYILYFGEKSLGFPACNLSMAALFAGWPKDKAGNAVNIERVSFLNARRQTEQCCRELAHQNHRLMSVGFHTFCYGILDLMVIHGLTSNPEEVNANPASWPFVGCPGVKEILFVVNSYLWHVDGGQVDRFTKFREAVHEGATMEESRTLNHNREFVKLSSGELPIKMQTRLGWGSKKWESEKPSCREVSLVRGGAASGREVFGAIELSRKDFTELMKANDFNSLGMLEKTLGCRISFSSPLPDMEVVVGVVIPAKKDIEVGFAGEQAAVDVALAWMQSRKDRCTPCGEVSLGRAFDGNNKWRYLL